jgi:GT2 family glycosyltransferase
VLVAPRVEGADGVYQYLCKRPPGLLTLGLRGFAPAWLRAPFAGLLARYEMRDVLGPQVTEPVAGIPLASGCFMLMRTAAVRAVGGFGDAYFLYFEDFDLSLRLGTQGQLVYLPAMRIIHLGGQAGRKGSHHRKLFLRSALTFFRRNGWRLG